ncbi:MAG TPA: hypothetical protein VG963_21810 [Polyangiaceae bacterium]|nr:hypothetical protein [Polyangiaceae bacterium]
MAAGLAGFDSSPIVVKLRGWLLKLAHPFFGGLDATLAIITGLLGSVYSPELKRWIEAKVSRIHGVTPTTCEVFSPGVKWFWWSLAITSAFHIVRSIAKQVEQQRVQEKYDKAASKIQDLVATNASPDYLQELGVAYEKCATICALADTPEKRKKALKYVLQSIAKLASVYDTRRSSGPQAVFVANLMWFIPSQDAGPWDSCVQFRGAGVSTTGVQGVLAMPAEFVASSEPNSPLAKLPNFALDVPIEAGSAQKGWAVLPGAPFAYIKKDFEHFHPGEQIAEWMKDHGDFQPSVIEKVGDYFIKNRDKIAGFMSLPIFIPTPEFQDASEREICGILNIHWSAADILDQVETARKFGHTIYPLRVLISNAMNEMTVVVP